MAVPVETDPDDPVGGGGAPGGGGTGTVAIGTPIFSFAFTKDEAASVMRVLAYASLSSGDDLVFTAFLTIDGTIHQAARVKATFDQTNSKSAMPITLPAYVPGLAAGQHNVIFSIRNQDVSGAALTVLTGSTIEITELKRAAV